MWLFEGYPERPERLKRWLLSGRDMRRMARRVRRGKDLLDDDSKFVQRLVRRSRRRSRVVAVVSEPGLTIAAELAGGIILALQVDRLTDPSRPGSLVAAIVGAALIGAGLFVARSREAYRQKVRDRSEGAVDRWIVQSVVESIEGVSDDSVERIYAEIADLRADVQVMANELHAAIRATDRWPDGTA